MNSKIKTLLLTQAILAFAPGLQAQQISALQTTDDNHRSRLRYLLQPFTVDNLTWGWPGGIILAAAVGLAYFLAALLSYRLSLESEGLAVFWPASGIAPVS